MFILGSRNKRSACPVGCIPNHSLTTHKHTHSWNLFISCALQTSMKIIHVPLFPMLGTQISYEGRVLALKCFTPSFSVFHFLTCYHCPFKGVDSCTLNGLILPSLLRIKATTMSELLSILMNPLIGNWKRKDSECLYLVCSSQKACGFKSLDIVHIRASLVNNIP